MNTLPAGWTATTFNSLGTLFCGQSPSSAAVNVVGKGTLYVTGPEQWDGESLHHSKWTIAPKRVVPEGCIFITVKGAGVGTLFPGVACAIGRDVYAFHPFPGLEVEFILLALKRNILSVKSSARGDIPGLSKGDILNHAVKVPPLPEQRRIVAKIDGLSAKSRRARDHLDHIPRLVEKYKQAILAAAFTHFSPGTSLGQSAEFVTSGSRGWAKYYSDNGATFIRVGNVQRSNVSLDWSDTQRVSPPLGSEGVRTLVRPNDLVITITADLGRVGVIPGDIGEAYVNQHIALVRLKRPEFAPFIAWYCASAPGQAQLLEKNRGATRAGLGLDDIRTALIPLPSLEEQLETVKKINVAFAWIDRLASEATSARKLIDHLDQAILAKAFRGELVSQDPNDEPASVLLERIRRSGRWKS